MSSIYFKEEQKFNQIWIWLIIAGLSGIWIWQMVQQIFMGIPFGNNPAPDLVVILTGIFPLGAILLFRFLILETIIDKEGIHYRFKPFQRKAKVIRPEDILRYEVKKYSPLKDYGGWGIRWGLPKNGTAYNVTGNMGALFELRNGKKFMLGTQNPELLRSSLNKLMAQSINQNKHSVV
jgi:hypothetical protein